MALWLGLTDTRMRIHRRIGITYIAAVTLGAVAGLYMGITADGGLVYAGGLIGLGMAWLLTTGMAFVAVTRALYDQHREWMIRSYAVTFAFVLFRVLFQALTANDIPPAEAAPFAAWASWVAPLLLTEAVLQGRKIAAAR